MRDGPDSEIDTLSEFVADFSPRIRLSRLHLKFESIRKRAFYDFDELIQHGAVNVNNYPEIAESIAMEMADKYWLRPESNAYLLGWHTLFSDLIEYANTHFPES